MPKLHGLKFDEPKYNDFKSEEDKANEPKSYGLKLDEPKYHEAKYHEVKSPVPKSGRGVWSN